MWGVCYDVYSSREDNILPYDKRNHTIYRGRPPGRPIPMQKLLYIYLGQSRTPVPTTSYIIYDLVGEGLAPPDFYANVTLQQARTVEDAGPYKLQINITKMAKHPFTRVLHRFLFNLNLVKPPRFP